MQPVLTIAICTYNRPDFLKLCLESVHPLLNEDVELMVVDNGTESVEAVCSNFSSVRYIKEEQTGLSFARNRAIVDSKGKYILYLDDDATVRPNFITAALRSCAHGYLVFGGAYHPWYFYGKPKWYKDNYAAWWLNYESDTKLSDQDFLHGGIMAYNKKVFEEAGTFRTDIGMIGMKVGYGEETELQHRIRQAGYSIYYIPDLLMDHLVAEYKLDVNWFMNAAKDLGRDMGKYHQGNKVLALIKASIIMVGLFLVNALPATFKLLLDRSYYKENWKMDVMKKTYKRWGFIQYLLKH